MTKIQPDISHHHPVVSWDEIEKQCNFLISKATEGTDFVDPSLKSFIRECEKRHIPYWLYAFLKSGNELEQAKFMVKTCRTMTGKYFRGYVLDIESNNKESSCIRALNYLKKNCKKQMIYTMYSQSSKYQRLIASRGSSCAWWEARYGSNTGSYSSKYPAHKGADLHQYTSNGRVKGLTGAIDLNKITGRKTISWFTDASTSKKTYSGVLPKLPERKYFKIGDKGLEVKSLQQFLTWAGFSCGSAGADGIYGPATSKAVLTYKKKVGLKANDGNFGKLCLAKAKTYKK